MARILVIEDIRETADTLQVMLELHGHEVAVVYSGPEGVAVAKVFFPDVVIADIGLPGLDGWGVVRELRKDPATAKALMIALTGYSSDEARARSKESGFDYHLVKPSDPVYLLGLIDARTASQNTAG
jgi:CheY-like chemotaxis protein